MIQDKITFDRFARWIVMAVLAVSLLALINYLSSVLLPFAIAWLLAYLLYPMVKFFQYRLHVPGRVLSIMATLLVVVSVITLIVWLIIPPLIEQAVKVKDIIINYFQTDPEAKNIPVAINRWLQENLDAETIRDILQQDDFKQAMGKVMPQVFNVLGETFSIVVSIVASFITLLYMFFILMDYESLTQKWIRIFPVRSRPFWSGLAGDVERALNSYIRGQSLVALIMGVLFCIGFTVIDFPLAIGLGILIGIMDLVPYLHSLALIPTVFLSLLKAADTGQSFWVILLSALAVFVVVQVIIDMVVTPKVMGKAMNLNPAILLLSLSVWGMLLGFIGLIIALPLTTILMTYYKRYVVRETEGEEQAAEQSPELDAEEVRTV